MSTNPYEGDDEFLALTEMSRDVDLARVALEIAADDYPDLDIDACMRTFDVFAERVSARCRKNASIAKIADQINWLLYVEEGFRGGGPNDKDPRLFYLNEVLRRKVGSHSTLAIIHNAVARRLGIWTEWIGNTPRAMFTLHARGPYCHLSPVHFYVDAYKGGKLIKSRDFMESLQGCRGGTVDFLFKHFEMFRGPAMIIVGLLLEMYQNRLNAGEVEEAYSISLRLTGFPRKDRSELTDHAIMCKKIGRIHEMIEFLEAYLETEPVGGLLKEPRDWLRAAQREVASWN
ncbi:MAG: hypothetical protein KGM43_12250 [Planctomycetota bacterium]|nr:hypothetical protein [Planctomycetota bacterium]